MKIPMFVFLLSVLHVEIRDFTISLFLTSAVKYVLSRAWLNLGKTIFRVVDSLLALGFFCFKKAGEELTDKEESNPPEKK